jgi:hypothetical protein
MLLREAKREAEETTQLGYDPNEMEDECPGVFVSEKTITSEQKIETTYDLH